MNAFARLTARSGSLGPVQATYRHSREAMLGPGLVANYVEVAVALWHDRETATWASPLVLIDGIGAKLCVGPVVGSRPEPRRNG